MLARQHDATIDGAQILVVLGPRLLCPAAKTAQRPGYAMPGHRDAMLIFGTVLGMNLRAPFDCLPDAFLRRQCRHLIGLGPEHVAAEQYAGAAVLIARVGIGDHADR